MSRIKDDDCQRDNHLATIATLKLENDSLKRSNEVLKRENARVPVLEVENDQLKRCRGQDVETIKELHDTINKNKDSALLQRFKEENARLRRGQAEDGAKIKQLEEENDGLKRKRTEDTEKIAAMTTIQQRNIQLEETLKIWQQVGATAASASTITNIHRYSANILISQKPSLTTITHHQPPSAISNIH